MSDPIVQYSQADDKRITAAVLTVEAMNPARRRGPGMGRNGRPRILLPAPTAANQVLIAKPHPTIAGKFVWEANWARWHS
jgi:hypothetical protein